MMLSAPATLLTAIATLLAILISIGTAILVARTRNSTGIQPPAMSGDARLERALRVQGNTVEGFIIFLPALWLAAIYFQGWAPPIIGLIWCLGRIVYAMGYSADADRRQERGLNQTKIVMAHRPGPRKARPECKLRVGHPGETSSGLKV